MVCWASKMRNSELKCAEVKFSMLVGAYRKHF